MKECTYTGKCDMGITDKEAKEQLQSLLAYMVDGEHQLVLIKAVRALSYRVPTKPEWAHHCPNCSKGLPYPGLQDPFCQECFKPKFCPECGQAILWEE